MGIALLSPWANQSTHILGTYGYLSIEEYGTTYKAIDSATTVEARTEPLKEPPYWSPSFRGATPWASVP
jgi:hypothetical protein